MKNLNPQKTIEDLTHEQLFLTTIFVLSLRLSYYQRDENFSEEFWGSDEDLALENYTYIAINKLMGFDVNEDEKWGSYLIKATVTEICEFSLEELFKAFPNYAPNSKKLFIVACETPHINEWPNMVCTQPEMFTFFDDERITQDYGWDEEQETTLNELPAKHALLCYGYFSHAIIRIR